MPSPTLWSVTPLKTTSFTLTDASVTIQSKKCVRVVIGNYHTYALLAMYSLPLRQTLTGMRKPPINLRNSRMSSASLKLNNVASRYCWYATSPHRCCPRMTSSYRPHGHRTSQLTESPRCRRKWTNCAAATSLPFVHAARQRRQPATKVSQVIVSLSCNTLTCTVLSESKDIFLPLN